MAIFKEGNRVCVNMDYLENAFGRYGIIEKIETFSIAHPDNVYTQATVLLDDGRRIAYVLEDLNLVIEF